MWWENVKSQLGAKIVNEMSEIEVSAGEGKDTVEKMRQKFINLQQQYLLHIKYR